MRYSLVVALALFAPWAGAQEAKASAAALPLVAGWWQIQATLEISGSPLPSLPKLSRVCITEAQIASGELRLPLIANCRLASSPWQGGKMSMNIVCPDMSSPARAQGEVRAAGKTLTGEAQIITGDGEESARFNVRHQGQWLQTECPPEPFTVKP